MEEEVQRLRAELKRINTEFEITLGRVNGMHMALLMVTRYWGRPAATLIAELREAIEKTEATSLPTPLPDSTIAETKRVAQQIVEMLAHADREGH